MDGLWWKTPLNKGWFGGGEPLYFWKHPQRIITSHCKDPYKPTRIQWKVIRFFFYRFAHCGKAIHCHKLHIWPLKQHCNLQPVVELVPRDRCMGLGRRTQMSLENDGKSKGTHPQCPHPRAPENKAQFFSWLIFVQRGWFNHQLV